MSKSMLIYTDEFRKQIVNLYHSGKTAMEITREYGISKTSLYKWAKNDKNSGSFRKKDNLTEDEKELIRLRKENKQLLMENDILKQVDLIMSRK
jgi:Transposase and inactivated derivatives